MNRELFVKGWSLLDPREKRRALLVLTVVVVSAFTSALMVGSIMPFLATLADPDRIREVDAFVWAYEAGGFRSDYGFLMALGFASLAVIVVANGIQMLRVFLVTKFAMMRMHSLSVRLLRVYLRQPYEFFLDKNSGELGTQILSETQQVVQLFYRPAAEAIAAVLTAVAIIALLVWINPLVAVIALTVAGGMYFGSFLISRKLIGRLGDTRADANKRRFRIANESLSGVKEVKLLGREANYVNMYAIPSLAMARAEAFANFIGTLPQYVMQIVAFGGMIVLVLALLDPAALSDADTMGDLLPLLGVFAFGGQRLMPELAKLYLGFTQLGYGARVVNSIHADLQDEHRLPRLMGAPVPPLGLKRALEFREVGYAYPNAEGPGVTGVTLRVEAGERIGIVGGSGAGKTTLADVAMGLLRHTDGEIVVDGTAITDDNIRSWQRSVGYVQQGIFLSDASVLENIALGVPPGEIDRERALDASRMARFDDFVRHDLPDGYETMVGERGVRLSGGQKQRIGIARALYHDADLIVFDEATSALDNVTEKEVMRSIDALPGNKTVILIAHRLTTLENCDRLIVMDRGRVVGMGTWDELLATNAQFRALAMSTKVTGEE
ncbi:MAG: ABC transporter ATP-binding protein [Maritimibacter sp.]|nr:ABC transporter ATP-binding protein [Maritimibacter sp.]